jgi:putative SOS response-associated peptidase YedK
MTRRLATANSSRGALSLVINARSKAVATEPAFRSAFKCRRCIFPASDYQASSIAKVWH